MKTDILTTGIVLSAHSLEVMTISQCEQCGCKIDKNLAETITTQMVKIAPEGDEPRLMCVACFCANGNRFTTAAHLHMEPLDVSNVEEEQELARKTKRIDRKKAKIKRGDTQVPNFSTLKRTIRWELSKAGRIGKPKGGKNAEGANTYLCPICEEPTERLFNHPGRSLDDVVHHLELSGCYDKFLAEESA
jgi:hypothetical protein